MGFKEGALRLRSGFHLWGGEASRAEPEPTWGVPEPFLGTINIQTTGARPAWGTLSGHTPLHHEPQSRMSSLHPQ